MDFTFTEEQETISKLARELFERRASPERLTELEAGETRYDVALWKELAAVDLLGTALPESVGGTGGGFGVVHDGSGYKVQFCDAARATRRTKSRWASNRV